MIRPGTTPFAALGAESLVLLGADHLLEVSGDVLATVERLGRLVEAVIGFAAM